MPPTGPHPGPAPGPPVAPAARPAKVTATEVRETTSAKATSASALRYVDVDLYRLRTRVLSGVNWHVQAGERWAVLGPNGSGKTTLVQLASGYLHPTRGRVEILGHRLGSVDVRALREQIATVSGGVSRMILPGLAAKEVVVAASRGALEPWWHTYSEAERERAAYLLTAAGFGQIAGRPFGVLSEGERQQVMLARALMSEPRLLLLDEPCAGLDMGGRERLLSRLASLAGDPAAAPVVLVTHHVEEIPEAFTHILLLRAGEVVAAGPMASTLSPENLSECFGLPLELRNDRHRWTSRAVRRA
jgi:iron complex transport system ATP-binding protein